MFAKPNVRRNVKSSTFALFAGLALSTLAPMSNAETKLGDGLYAEMETTKGKIVIQLEFEKTPFVGEASSTVHPVDVPLKPARVVARTSICVATPPYTPATRTTATLLLSR